MQQTKDRLILVQSTDSPVGIHVEKGIWDRQKFSLSQYAKEFQVDYYTSDPQNHQELMPAGVRHRSGRIKTRTFGLNHIAYYFFLLVEAFKWRKYDNAVVRIIGVNVPVVPLLKMISAKKFVISYQFDWAYGMKKDYKGIKPIVSAPVQSFVIGAADHLICTTRWLADIAMRRYGVPDSRITIIPNYVNISIFRPREQKKKQIAFAGRLHWSKGIDTLIAAFNKFAVIHPDYKLVIMGSGEEEENLRKLVAPQSPVEFKGSVSNVVVAQVLNESEIFVLPTVNMEGHPKALVEAMAAGCKCITSDVPGNNHVLMESDSADLLFESRNADHLCDRLLYAVTQNSKKQYTFALSNYSSEICFEREIGLLKTHVTR